MAKKLVIVKTRITHNEDGTHKVRHTYAKRTVKTRKSRYIPRCQHMRPGGSLNIKWMEHSDGVVRGVCGTCFRPFDSRTRYGKRYLKLSGALAQKNMGRCLPPEPPKPWKQYVPLALQQTVEAQMIDARETQLTRISPRPRTFWEDVKALLKRMYARANFDQEW